VLVSKLNNPESLFRDNAVRTRAEQFCHLNELTAGC
jgi:hypothetical protein